MKDNKRKSPHSQEWLGEWRDLFWNQDFLDLMAKRWRLNQASFLTDIGIGLGHWSKLLFIDLGKV